MGFCLDFSLEKIPRLDWTEAERPLDCSAPPPRQADSVRADRAATDAPCPVWSGLRGAVLSIDYIYRIGLPGRLCPGRACFFP